MSELRAQLPEETILRLTLEGADFSIDEAVETAIGVS